MIVYFTEVNINMNYCVLKILYLLCTKCVNAKCKGEAISVWWAISQQNLALVSTNIPIINFQALDCTLLP